jgi:hypothetical protein
MNRSIITALGKAMEDPLGDGDYSRLIATFSSRFVEQVSAFLEPRGYSDQPGRRTVEAEKHDYGLVLNATGVVDEVATKRQRCDGDLIFVP